jgi:hypothetical protein
MLRVYNSHMATWDDVRKIAAKLPEAEESTTHRQPCFKVGGKLFVNMSSHEPGAIAVRVPVELQHPMVESRPDLFFVTPHYEGYGAVLIRLETVKRADLTTAVRNAYEHVRAGLPKKRASPPRRSLPKK